MAKRYPVIGKTENRNRNTHARCRCGEIAKFRVHIEVNIFRGDDEVEWSCDEHKKDVNFLLLIAGSSANSFIENPHKCARCHNCNEIGATYDVNGLKFCAWECFAEWDREEQKSLDEFAKEYEEFYITKKEPNNYEK